MCQCKFKRNYYNLFLDNDTLKQLYSTSKSVLWNWKEEAFLSEVVFFNSTIVNNKLNKSSSVSLLLKIFLILKIINTNKWINYRLIAVAAMMLAPTSLCAVKAQKNKKTEVPVAPQKNRKLPSRIQQGNHQGGNFWSGIVYCSQGVQEIFFYTECAVKQRYALVSRLIHLILEVAT
jgi:hypothetical protein